MKHCGHLAQIVGECLMMHYDNVFRNNVATRKERILTDRMVNYYVNFFRFELKKKQSDDLHGVPSWGATQTTHDFPVACRQGGVQYGS